MPRKTEAPRFVRNNTVYNFQKASRKAGQTPVYHVILPRRKQTKYR